MKAYICLAKKIAFCALLVTALLLTASAATWDEMRENGAVSDGGIRLGDARDGIVSDVSEHGENGILGDIITDASDAIQDGLDGIDGSKESANGGDMGGATTPKVTTSDMMSDNAPGATGAPGTTGMGGNAANGEQDGGMAVGIIIAILVVAAVVVVIFLLIPKRKQ